MSLSDLEIKDFEKVPERGRKDSVLIPEETALELQVELEKDLQLEEQKLQLARHKYDDSMHALMSLWDNQNFLKTEATYHEDIGSLVDGVALQTTLINETYETEQRIDEVKDKIQKGNKIAGKEARVAKTKAEHSKLLGDFDSECGGA